MFLNSKSLHRLFDMKNSLILFLLVLLSSCSTLSDLKQAPKKSTVFVYENSSINVSQSPTVLLRIRSGTGHFADNIYRRVEALGFKITTENERSDYYSYVDYKTYFDVVHNTFVYFEIAFVDTKTNEIELRLRYVGGLWGFNGCNKALDLLFQDASKYIKKGT